MKSSLSVRWDKSEYVIVDVSPAVLKILDINSKAEDVIGNPLSLPLCIKYLDLVRKSPIHYMEVLYPIKEVSYTVKIVEEGQLFTLYFESLFCPVSPKIYSSSIDNSFFEDVEEMISNDKTITEIFSLRNASKENINLEILYIVKKLEEELKNLKKDAVTVHDNIHKEIEDIKQNYVKDADINFYYVLERIGVKKFIIFLFIIAVIESVLLEPFIAPILKQIQESITTIVDD